MGKTTGKADDAFRTIREVADWLGVQTHVLRFWESKFDKVSPVKGAGGRRYYRPEDMLLLGGIKVLLHDQGQTIRGVAQKIDDEGVDPVRALSKPIDKAGKDGAGKDGARKPAKAGDEAPGDVVAFKRKAPADEVDTTQPDKPAKADAAPVPPADTMPDPAAQKPQDAPPPSQPDVPDLPDGAGARVPGEAVETPDMPDEPPVAPPSELPGEPDAPPQPEPDTVAATPEAPPASTVTQPPTVAALDLVRGASGCSDQRRLRRVIRRLRGLIEEIEEDLAS